MPSARLLETLARRAQRLYTLPSVATRVLELTSRPQDDLTELRRCLENDPALVAKLLRVVNSSLFGLHRKVGDLQQTLNVLGMNPLKMLVLGFSLPDRLFRGINGAALSRYWHRTLLTATVAREISRSRGTGDPDELFLAGMLGEIGILTLLQEYGQDYSRLLTAVDGDPAELARRERQALGFDHVQTGTMLLEHWKLPAELIAFISTAFQERGPQGSALPADDSIEIVRLSRRMSWALASKNSGIWRQIAADAQTKFSIQTPQLLELLDVARTHVEHLAADITIPLNGDREFEALALTALDRLGELSEQRIAGEIRATQLTDESQISAADAAERLQAVAGKALYAAREIVDETAATARDAWPAIELPGSDGAGIASRRPASEQPPIEIADARSEPNPFANSTITVSPAIAPITTKPLYYSPVLRQTTTTLAVQCRQVRQALSLALIMVDEVTDDGAADPEVDRRLYDALWKRIQDVPYPRQIALKLNPKEFAVLMPDCERRAAIQWANDLQRHAAELRAAGIGEMLRPGLRLSVGISSVAVPAKNFLADQLIQAAQRCLDGARLSGGNTLKSIEST